MQFVQMLLLAKLEHIQSNISRGATDALMWKSGKLQIFFLFPLNMPIKGVKDLGTAAEMGLSLSTFS